MTPTRKLHQEAVRRFQAGDYAAAEQLLDEALARARAENDPALMAEVLNDLGVVQRQLGDHQAALAALQQAMEHFTSAEDNTGRARTLGNLAAVYESQEKFEEAVDTYKEAATVFEAVGETELAMYTWQAVSRLRMKQGQWIAAIGAYEEGVENMPERSLKRGFLTRLLRLPGKMLPGSKDEDDDADEE
jgi:tetratricopeptide (TPR) repeat protein